VGSLGTIITAAVTPFAGDGSVDEQAFVALLEHLAANGSDGVVVCGTTGEASTLTDAEHLRVVELAVNERPQGLKVIAGVGSNDTRHAVSLTAAASALGVDGLLSVNPYYNRPSRAGVIAHYREITKAADKPILLYNIPQRTGSDMDNELLAELGQLDHIIGVKQSNTDNLALIDGLELYAGNDEDFTTVLDLGGAGGISVASHIVGPELRRLVDEPEQRADIFHDLQQVFETLSIAPLAVSTKAALNLMGIEAGRPRLPYVELNDNELQELRLMLETRGLLAGAAR